MTRIAWAAILAAGTAVVVCAQTPAAFDVASVRPAGPEPPEGKGRDRRDKVNVTPGNVVMRNITMTGAIKWAYDVEAYQVSGPSWMENTRFDIVAKPVGPATDAEMRAMMQTLLANRFKLTVHREKKEMAGMALLVGKGGSKLKASEDQGESSFEPGKQANMTISFGHMSMREFASLLSQPMQKPVWDLTGLTGKYDFMLDGRNYVPPEPAPGQPREGQDESYMVLRALQEQLGLKLEPRKMTVEIVAVDGIEKTPTEN